jgi:NAD(P)H dehydrogenase (quinone)
MKIGIAVHSETGVTLKFAGMVADRLRSRGHTVEVLPLEPEGTVRPHQSDVKLKSIPDCSGLDVLMIGGPIWAFGMSPVAVAFASSLKNLSGKKVMPFATMASPLPFMGGVQGISRLRRCLEKTGATVLQGVIGTAWAGKAEPDRQKVVDRVSAMLGA